VATSLADLARRVSVLESKVSDLQGEESSPEEEPEAAEAPPAPSKLKTKVPAPAAAAVSKVLSRARKSGY
jgi:hypothetical protein